MQTLSTSTMRHRLLVPRCTHKLSLMPRWLSSQKMEVVRSLLVRNLPARPVPPQSNARCVFAVRGPRHAVSLPAAALSRAPQFA